MNRKIKWGILGLGNIAHKFAQDLLLHDDAILHAVGSRNMDKATDFAKQYQVVKSYASYEALAADPDIDVIYIATPHVLHCDNTLMCLRHGKGVLCEKPMGMQRDQVERMQKEAKAQNVFLMEGLWTRFIPATQRMLELIKQGEIGRITHMYADFGFQAPVNAEGRLFNKALGGGSLLDVGIYPVFLSLLTLGVPTSVKAMARKTSTGIDSYCAMLLNFDNGAIASLASSIESNTPVEARLYGEHGTLTLHRNFHHAEKITLEKDGNKQVFDVKYTGNGYYHEIEEVHHCLANQQLESRKFPLSASLGLIFVLDRVREEIGLDYGDVG